MDIGIIGLGAMGQLYAHRFAQAGHTVRGCDTTHHRDKLEQQLEDVIIEDDGVAVSRASDLIIYSVPVHSLHGPSVEPDGQTLIMIHHRAPYAKYFQAKNAFKALGSNIIEMTDYYQHDRITADTQAVTHIGFESMGTAWMNAGFYPWNNASYQGGIDNVKTLLTLRIYSGTPHVYSGLAMLNPYAKQQIQQYARSEAQLFEMMIRGDADIFNDRVTAAGDHIFGNQDTPIMLDDSTMGEYSLGCTNEQTRPNSHLSLLAMVDAWHQLGTNPYQHMICQTPVFKLRLGIAEYLFRNTELLDQTLYTAVHNPNIRSDDLKFHTAVHQWASIVQHGDRQGYEQLFDTTHTFFADTIPKAKSKSDNLIRRLR